MKVYLHRGFYHVKHEGRVIWSGPKDLYSYREVVKYAFFLAHYIILGKRGV